MPARRSNSWFSTSRKSSGKVSSGHRSSMSLAQALRDARKAGYRSGDTGMFDSWARSKGLSSRGDVVLRRLRDEYSRGFEQALSDERKAQTDKGNAAFLARQKRQEADQKRLRDAQEKERKQEAAKALAKQKHDRAIVKRAGGYKGFQLFKTGDGNWHYSGERESAFDSLSDVRHFVDSIRNPKRRNKDVIDDAAETGMQISGSIFAIPAAVLDKTIKTTLSAKDAIKKKFNSVQWEDAGDDDIRRDLLFSASRSRNAEELARIYKWAVAKRDREMQSVAEARASELGIPLSKLKSSTRWNPTPGMRAARRKRNPESTAAHLYQKFHGEPSGEEVVFEEEEHYHSNLAVLGTLCSLVVDTPTGLQATITFEERGDDAPFLTSTEDGKQLYIESGNQELDLKALKMDGNEWVKERMVIGTFSLPTRGRKWNISYVTTKSFDRFQTIEYQHDLSEQDEGQRSTKRRAPAVLEYDSVNKRLFIIGGQYKIDIPIVGVSPGIEN